MWVSLKAILRLSGEGASKQKGSVIACHIMTELPGAPRGGPWDPSHSPFNFQSFLGPVYLITAPFPQYHLLSPFSWICSNTSTLKRLLCL